MAIARALNHHLRFHLLFHRPELSSTDVTRPSKAGTRTTTPSAIGELALVRFLDLFNCWHNKSTIGAIVAKPKYSAEFTRPKGASITDSANGQEIKKAAVAQDAGARATYGIPQLKYHERWAELKDPNAQAAEARQRFRNSANPIATNATTMVAACVYVRRITDGAKKLWRLTTATSCIA
jgi:hypothetical protein